MRSRPLTVLVLTVFLDLLGFGLIIPILPYLAERYGASPLVATALMAAYSLMQVVFAPLWGSLSDRFGRRPIILMSLAVTTVGYVLLAAADGLVWVFAARLLSGVGNANIATAQAYIADVTAPADRARGMGLIGLAFGLGFIFGPAVGGYLGGIDVALPAWAAAGATLLDLVLAWTWLAEPKTHRPATRTPVWSIGSYRHAARLPDVGRLFLVFFAATFAFAQLESTFALFVEHRWHRSPETTLVASDPATNDDDPEPRVDAHRQAARDTGSVLFFVGLVAAIVQGGLIGRLSRRFGEKRLLVAGLILEGMGLGLTPLAPSVAGLFAIGALIAVGNGLLSPSLTGLVSRRADAHSQGATLGLAQSLGSLARVVGPILGGALFQYVTIGMPFYLGALLLFITAGIAAPIGRAPAISGAGPIS